MKVDILGVKIDDVTMDEAVEIVLGWLRGNLKHYIITPNPEFIVAAQQDKQFRKILNSADLAIPDGKGLRLTGIVKHTVAGCDLMEVLCAESAEKGFRVGLLGGRDGVALKAARVLKEKYPGLKVVFAEDGPEIATLVTTSLRALDVAPRLPSPFVSTTDILFVALGMGKQEKWIVENLDKVNSRVFMGVGGAFDYISGKVPRAPLVIRKIGCEWLFRLIFQPWRIKRQLALLKFVFLVLTNRK